MKRVFSIIILILAVTMAASAQLKALSSTQRIVGYVTGDVINTNNVGTGHAGTQAVGAVVTADMLEPYVGCKIVGMRFALSTAAQTSRIFIRPIGADGYLASADSVTQSVWHPRAGWNEVMLNGVKGYTVRSGESLFFGFDETETTDQVSAGTGNLATATGSQPYGFVVFGNFGSGEGLYAINGKGLLCVQLIVDVSSWPSKALAFTAMTNGYQYKQPGDVIDFFAEYQNLGRDTINSYTINYSIDDKVLERHDTTDVVASGASSSIERIFNLPTDLASGQHVLRVYISKADGQELSEQPSIADTFCVYREKFDRQMTYLEQYADAQSAYTAGCFDAMQSAVTAMKGSVAYVNVYRDGNPLACNEASSLSQDYAYTYPSFTMDRSYYPGEAHVAYDLNNYVLVAPSLVAGMMQELLQDEHRNPAFAQLSIDPKYDATTRNLTLTVSGTTTSEAHAIFGDLALTLMLTEDSVVSPQVVYNASTQTASTVRQYTHNHVLRSIITATRGDKLQLDGNTFTATYRVALPQSVDPAHATVVGLVTRYVDPSAPIGIKRMDVLNANAVSLKNAASGVTTVRTATQSKPVYYRLDGTQVSPDEAQHGIFIVRYGDGTVKKIMR